MRNTGMQTLNTSNSALFEISLSQKILQGQDDATKSALKLLLSAVEHPADKPSLQSVVQGAVQSFEAAMRLIEHPNLRAKEIQGQLQVLSDSISKEYGLAEVCDLKSSLRRRLTEFPAWRSLAEVSFLSHETEVPAAMAALGFNLGLALAQEKKMASAYCKNVRKDLTNLDLPIEQFLWRPAGDPLCDVVV